MSRRRDILPRQPFSAPTSPRSRRALHTAAGEHPEKQCVNSVLPSPSWMLKLGLLSVWLGHRAEPVEQPCSAGTPGITDHLVSSTTDSKAPGPVWRSRRQPPTVLGKMPMKRPQSSPQVKWPLNGGPRGVHLPILLVGHGIGTDSRMLTMT